MRREEEKNAHPPLSWDSLKSVEGLIALQKQWEKNLMVRDEMVLDRRQVREIVSKGIIVHKIMNVFKNGKEYNGEDRVREIEKI